MNWTEEFAAEVRTALASGEARRIIVPTEARAELGLRAVDRLAQAMGGDGSLITFEIRPAEEDWQRRDFEQGIYEAADEQDRLEIDRDRAARQATKAGP